MAARQVGRAAIARCLHQRPQTGPHTGDVGFGDRAVRARGHRRIEGAQHVGDVFGRALRVVERAAVVGVGGAYIGVPEGAVAHRTPRHEEQAALVFRNGNDHSDVVAHQVPRHGDVHAFGGANAVGVGAFVERAHGVGPHACGVHHLLRAHGEAPPVGFHAHQEAALVVASLGDRHHVAPVGHCGAAVGGSACHSEHQACIVDRCVVIQIGGEHAVGRHGGHVRHCSVALQAAMQFADAPPAGEVVHPHRRTERTGDLAVHHALGLLVAGLGGLAEDGDHERHHAHQVRGVAA